MARYPDALWKPLPENETEPRITPTQVILHSAVSASDSIHGYFARPDVFVESHFYVRDDGTVEQYVDTTRQADANYKANARAISIETQDRGNPDKYPWTKAQLASLIRLVRWCCDTHGIPKRRCTAWDAPGIGYHSQFPGVWTPVRGKTCPGIARRLQVTQIITAVAADDEEDDMPYTEEQLSRIVAEAVHGSQIGRSGLSLAVMLERTYSRSQEAAAGVTRVASALGERPDVQVDTDELAAAIAAAIPADLAQRVIDALGERINTPGGGR